MNPVAALLGLYFFSRRQDSLTLSTTSYNIEKEICVLAYLSQLQVPTGVVSYISWNQLRVVSYISWNQLHVHLSSFIW